MQIYKKSDERCETELLEKAVQPNLVSLKLFLQSLIDELLATKKDVTVDFSKLRDTLPNLYVNYEVANIYKHQDYYSKVVLPYVKSHIYLDIVSNQYISNAMTYAALAQIFLIKQGYEVEWPLFRTTKLTIKYNKPIKKKYMMRVEWKKETTEEK